MEISSLEKIAKVLYRCVWKTIIFQMCYNLSLEVVTSVKKVTMNVTAVKYVV